MNVDIIKLKNTASELKHLADTLERSAVVDLQTLRKNVNFSLSTRTDKKGNKELVVSAVLTCEGETTLSLDSYRALTKMSETDIAVESLESIEPHLRELLELQAVNTLLRKLNNL